MSNMGASRNNNSKTTAVKKTRNDKSEPAPLTAIAIKMMQLRKPLGHMKTPKAPVEEMPLLSSSKLDPILPKELGKSTSPFKISDSYRETKDQDMAASNRQILYKSLNLSSMSSAHPYLADKDS
jgi:hypothetical protein